MCISKAENNKKKILYIRKHVQPGKCSFYYPHTTNQNHFCIVNLCCTESERYVHKNCKEDDRSLSECTEEQRVNELNCDDGRRASFSLSLSLFANLNCQSRTSTKKHWKIVNGEK